MTRRQLGLASLALLLAPCAAALGACQPSGAALCLAGARFSAEVQWKDFAGNTGPGHAVALTSDTGYFWFFGPTNVELVVKVLDGRGLNGHFWVFYGALSNVEYEMTVRDSETGDVRSYRNPSGQFASTGDTLAFPPDSGSLGAARSSGRMPAVGIPAYGLAESALLEAAPESAAACTPTPTSLCLSGGRFRLTATWTDFAGNTGAGQAVSLTSDTGYFWFFGNSNVELVVKALDGRALNDHYWIFYGALSNVEYTMTVTDTVTGIVKTYSNPSGRFASVGDTLAFGKPTTFGLIDGAVVKGEIDADTALLYKVYAFFDDPRLPRTYLGDPPETSEHAILLDVVGRWSTLSATAQQALQPFLVPPIYPESWFAQPSASRSLSPARSSSTLADWTRIEKTNAVIWYRAADAGAQTAANNLAAEIERVWDKETTLMNRKPLSDENRNQNGGDGRFDIYVLPSFRDPDPSKPSRDDGITTLYLDQEDIVAREPRNVERAAYILIRISSASTPQGARAVLSHEFFHALAVNQKHSGGLMATHWLNEATATYMEDYVYPTEIDNSEHGYARLYLNPAGSEGYRESFNWPTHGGYEDYLFLFYLARSIPSTPSVPFADVIRRIWKAVETMPALQAIDASIPGGFQERWPEFGLYCWNRPDVDKFAGWDKLTMGLVGASAEPHLRLQSGDPDGISLPQRYAPNLAISYAFIEVLSDSIKQVEIRNQPVVGNAAYAKTQAWIKLADGSTRVEDWTDKPRVVFCRDKTSENVTELLILYTNSGPSRPVVWDEGKVTPYTVGCGGFHGTVRETRRGPGQGGVTANETMDVTAKFLPHPLRPDHYYLAQISMQYSFSAYNPLTQCTLTVDPVTQTASFGYEESDLNEIVIDRSATPPTYSATGNWGFIASARSECGGQPGGTVPTGVGGQWWKVPGGFFSVNRDGSLSGDNSETLDGVTTTWTWNLVPD